MSAPHARVVMPQGGRACNPTTSATRPNFRFMRHLLPRTNSIAASRLSAAAVIGAGWIVSRASAADEGLWNLIFGRTSGATPATAPGAVPANTASAVQASPLRGALDRFTSPEAWIEPTLGIAAAIVLVSLIALHPRATRQRDALKSLEERKALVLVGVVAAAAAAIVRVEPMAALLFLGIGWLVRPRAGSGSAQLAAHTVLVIAIGLACGLSQFVVAIVVTLAAWIVVWWLQSRRNGEVKVRLPVGSDLAKAELVSSHEARALGCHVRAVRAGSSGRSFTLALGMPASLAGDVLCEKLRARLAADIGHCEVEIRLAP